MARLLPRCVRVSALIPRRRRGRCFASPLLGVAAAACVAFATLAAVEPAPAYAQPPAVGALDDPQAGPFMTRRAREARFLGHMWMGWAADLTEGYGFPNQFFLNRVDLRFEGNLDDAGKYGFRVRLESTSIGLGDSFGGQQAGQTHIPGGAVPTIGGGYVYFKQAFLQIQRVFFSNDLMRFGATAMPWIPFAEDMFGYRILRATGPELWGYQSPSDIGFTHFLRFNENLITIQYGVWNGDYTAKGIDGFGGTHLVDYFKTFALGIVVRDPSGFSAQAAFLLQNQTGDDARVFTFDDDGNVTGVELDTTNTGGVPMREVEDGFRVQAGVYYRQPLGLSFGLEAGVVIDRGLHDALSAWGTIYAVFNLAMIADTMDWIEVIARFDVHQLDFNDPTRNEPGDMKYYRPDGSLRFFLIDPENKPASFNDQFLGGWEFGITVAVSWRVDPLVTILAPVFKGDYSDARRDSNQIGVYVDIRF